MYVCMFVFNTPNTPEKENKQRVDKGRNKLYCNIFSNRYLMIKLQRQGINLRETTSKG